VNAELILPSGARMPIRDRRAGATLEVRDPRGATTNLGWTSPGREQTQDWDAQQAWKLGVLMNVVAYRCVQLRARAASTPPLVAGRRKGDAKTINEAARITQLLGPPPGGPAPKLSATKLFRWTHAQHIVSGRRAWEIETDDNGVPVAFWPLPSASLRPVPSQRGTEWFSSFRFGKPSDPVTFRPDEVFYGWDPSGLDFRQAESGLQSARFDLSLVAMCDQYGLSFLRNNAVPAAIVTTTEFPDEAHRRRFLQSWQAEFGGAANAGRVAINEVGEDGDGPVGDSIDVKVLGMSARDARLVEMRKDLVHEIAIALGTPFSKLDASGRTFDNASQEDLDWWETTILPDLEDLEDDINMQLAPRLGDEVVWFDLRGIRALQRRIVPITQTVGAPSLVRAQLMTINEARADYGLETIEGGDRFMTAEEIQALSGSQSQGDEAARAALATIEARMAELEQRGAEQVDAHEVPHTDERPNEPPTTEQRELDPETIEARRTKIWRSADAAARTLEARWERAMQRLFTRQEESTVARLTGKRGRQLLREGRSADASEVFDEQFWAAETRQVAEDLYEQVVVTAGTQLAARFEIDFDLATPWVEEFIALRSNQLAGGVTQTTYEAIQRELTEGVSKGESIDDLAERIRSLFRQTYAKRAETVARTEVISAYNGATAAGGAALPADVVAGQEWISTRDGRTRSAHASVDGQVVPIGATFTVGGQALAYPGDPAGGAKNTVNCRCTLALLTPEEMAEMGRSRRIDTRAALTALRLVDVGDFDEARFRRALEAA
jgi:HK97 family phage portal protein